MQAAGAEAAAGAGCPLPTSVGVLPAPPKSEGSFNDEVGEEAVEGGEEEGEGGVVGDRVPLAAAEKEAVVRCVEFLILNFEEVFAI